MSCSACTPTLVSLYPPTQLYIILAVSVALLGVIVSSSKVEPGKTPLPLRRFWPAVLVFLAWFHITISILLTFLRQYEHFCWDFMSMCFHVVILLCFLVVIVQIARMLKEWEKIAARSS